jgi:serine phosphatase RsbU (regulator of sigma subunit)
MEAMSLAPPRDRMPERGGSLRGWLYAVGLVGLAIAVASIADMFSARPNDGIVPIPYRTGGIEVRGVAPGGPARQAGIASGDCVLGIGSHLVKSISDASRELRRHRIGETVPYLVRRGPCVIAASAAAPEGEMRTVAVRLSSIRLGGITTVYTAVLGFLFFFIGLFVFQRRPDDRAAQVFFLLCVLFLLFFVCRLRPSSYWWIDVFVQNTGTVSLFLLPAVFLHFFLIFPRPKRLTFAKADEWSEKPPARWKVRAQEFLSASPELLYLIYSIPPVVFLYDVFRQLEGHHVSILSGAPLSSWVLLGDYLVLGILALAHSAFTLEDPGERRQAFHVLVGTILGTTPFVLLGVVLPSLFNNDDYVFYGIVPMILIPLTFAYAIVRFQMMNIRLVVKRTFLYAGTTAILFGLYIAAIATANALFARRLSASPLFNFGFFLVVVPLFELVRRRLQTPLDKLFFREKFDYQAALLEMSEAITGELDLGKITDYLTASVAATMRLEKASIWLRDRDGFLERRGRRDDRVSPDAGVRNLLRREGKPVALDELSLSFSDPESRSFRERLEAEGFRLVVPLVYRERLMGVLALKEKLSGERFDREDRALLSTLANQAALAIETALLHDEMTRQAEFRRDLEIARDIQSSLLPRSVPIVPGFTLLGGSLPAKVVGGDFYDFIPFEDKCLGVVIGDVSGKSVPASLLMVASKEIVYSRALTTRDPGVLFQESNRRIYSIKRRMFVSLGYFVLDPDAMSLRYAIGGQPLPILLRSGDGGPRPLEPPEHRLPLGAFREVPYDTREIYLKRGDLIFFYTDGFSEAMDEGMNPFGEERLMQSLAARKEESLEDVANGILADIRRHVGGAEQYDDMTFLLLRVE